MRKTQAKKLPLAPDAKYNDILVTCFVNNLMWEGKKNTAYVIFYDALEKVQKTTNENGYDIWKRALSNVTPAVEVRSRRIAPHLGDDDDVLAANGRGQLPSG